MSSQVFQHTLPFGGFSSVVVRSQFENELLITQGDNESLDIEAPAEIARQVQTRITQDTLYIEYIENGDVLASAISRQRLLIHYHLTLRQLSRLELHAAITVRIPALKTAQLSVNFDGPGQIKIDDLQAERLKIYLPGPCKARLAGRVIEQYVEISGPGDYQAPYLESDKAEIIITAVGNATVWAHDILHATMQGIGNISYYGSPTVHKSTSPLGRLIQLDR